MVSPKMQSNKNKLDNESFFMLKFNESIDSVILFTFKGVYMVFFCFQSDIIFLSHPLSAWLFSALLHAK